MTKQIRVVIVGNSPLPIENTSRNYAPGIRTWHFAYSARDANCKVLVIGNRIPKSYDTNAEPIIENIIDDIEYCSVEPRLFEDKSWLTKKIMNFKPDCVVGVNPHPCSVLSKLDLSVPFSGGSGRRRDIVYNCSSDSCQSYDRNRVWYFFTLTV